MDKAYRPGLQALGAYSKKIRLADPKIVTGSVDIDSTLAKTYAASNRWDYGIGLKRSRGKECAVWVEIHGAVVDEVGTLVRKVTWLKDYLKAYAPELWTLTLATPEAVRFVWLGTKDVHLSKNSPGFRRAAQAGIALHGTSVNLS